MSIAALVLAVVSQQPVPTSSVSTTEGLEALYARLRERTAERRASAIAAWEQYQAEYLADPVGFDTGSLSGFAPELQEPLLMSLGIALRDKKSDDQDALLDLLAVTVNSAGARRLEAYWDRLELPQRLQALNISVGRGEENSWLRAVPYLTNGETPQRVGALQVLLKFGPVSEADGWLSAIPLREFEAEDLGDSLQILGERKLPADFALPESLLLQRAQAIVEGLLAVMEQAPQEGAEELLFATVVDKVLSDEMRSRALRVFEKSNAKYRWRNSARKLAEHLKDHPTDAIAYPMAWALHRMGQKEGAKFLLREPEQAVKSRPRDWRTRLALSQLYVRLSEFGDGYKEFNTVYEQVKNNSFTLRQITSEDWLYGARAAAGARRTKDAGDWLERARMSPRELEPYKDLPEFKPLLNKQPFKRLFGLN